MSNEEIARLGMMHRANMKLPSADKPTVTDLLAQIVEELREANARSARFEEILVHSLCEKDEKNGDTYHGQ